jgi:hypothetical protein
VFIIQIANLFWCCFRVGTLEGAFGRRAVWAS